MHQASQGALRPPHLYPHSYLQSLPWCSGASKASLTDQSQWLLKVYMLQTSASSSCLKHLS
jgi:hypothetical protein